MYACYVPDVGAVYRIKVAGLPQACLDVSHVEFNWSAGVSDHAQLAGLDVDDHRQYLLTNEARTTNGFAVTGTPEVGNLPRGWNGFGVLWHPKKMAFRAGDNPSWRNDEDIGDYSVAMGRYTKASGAVSAALGLGSAATGLYSTAMGNFASATGFSATATGWSTVASGDGATALGINAEASGSGSLALGNSTVASGQNSVAMGFETNATEFGQVVLGHHNESVLGGRLVIGNGSPDRRGNAFVAYESGDLRIAGSLVENSDARRKDDIQPLTDVFAKLAGIRGVTFRFREGEGPDGQQIGVLAQEVQQAFPALVHEDEQGRLSVSYTHLTAVLLTAIQEQQGQIEALRARLTTLENDRAR